MTKEQDIEVELQRLSEKLEKIKARKNKKNKRTKTRLPITLKIGGTVGALFSGLITLIPILGYSLFKSKNDYVKYSVLFVFVVIGAIILIYLIPQLITDFKISRIRKKMKRIRAAHNNVQK